MHHEVLNKQALVDRLEGATVLEHHDFGGAQLYLIEDPGQPGGKQFLLDTISEGGLLIRGQ